MRPPVPVECQGHESEPRYNRRSPETAENRKSSKNNWQVDQ